MAKMNLLKANWTGKLGETVGANWKGIKVLRSYTKPTQSRTAAQDIVRLCFKRLEEYLYLFTDQLKPYCALSLTNKSVRNAITSLNKPLFAAPTFDYADVLMSSGGLLVPTITSTSATAASGACTINGTISSVAPFGSRALVVGIIVNTTQKLAAITTTPMALSFTLTATVPCMAGDELFGHIYSLDYRGYRKVASRSVGQAFGAVT
jgi:hypothetical protein